MRFAQLTSNIVPREENTLNPTICFRLQSSTSLPRVGLSPRNATVSPIGICNPAVAFNPKRGIDDAQRSGDRALVFGCRATVAASVPRQLAIFADRNCASQFSP